MAATSTSFDVADFFQTARDGQNLSASGVTAAQLARRNGSMGDLGLRQRVVHGASDPLSVYDATSSSSSDLCDSRKTAKGRRLAQMFKDERYADCTVRVGTAASSETFRTNRTLLARCSEVFGKMLFEQRPQADKDAEVHLPGCSAAAFRQLLRCAHDLEPAICEANFVEVFQLAQKYEVEELRDAVGDWMKMAAARPVTALRAIDAAASLAASLDEEVQPSKGLQGLRQA
eukprot:TRINITY_DN45492_c0_g1_i3.p1 TRINITY_DN45492_c0_g1~~TRINITY_DN45492_c0_g1_i3.p1  ORF type:complete len:231 (-),score=60.36 TRINITY_DN45492_c0_g1_i3:61-753(-)